MGLTDVLGRTVLNALDAIGFTEALSRRMLAHPWKPRFANDPKNLGLRLPYYISHPERITLGDDVQIGAYAMLHPLLRYQPRGEAPPGLGELPPQEFDPELRIGNRVRTGMRLQIFVQNLIVIEDDVNIASNVFMNDALHGYNEIDRPFRDQPLQRIQPIHIHRGCWIGQNVVIMPGVRCGPHSIVGANSVVTRDIPPRSIAVGAPARVIRTWSDEEGGWRDVVSRPDHARARD